MTQSQYKHHGSPATRCQGARWIVKNSFGRIKSAVLKKYRQNRKENLKRDPTVSGNYFDHTSE